MRFLERLELQLDLTLGSQTFSARGGAVKALRAELESYGFEAEAQFIVSAEQEADPVLEAFTGDDPIAVAVKVRTVREAPDGSDAEQLAFSGLVTERRLREWVGEDVTGRPVRLRRYTVRFADPAAVLWRQHFPTELSTATTLHAVIDAQRPEGVTVSWDWRLLEADQAMVFLGLGGEDDGEASFYDWLCWLVSHHQGVWEWKASDGTYRLGGAKSTDATPAALDAEIVVGFRHQIPVPLRRSARMLNGAAVAASTVPVANAQAVIGVSRDVLVRTPILSEVAKRGVLEASRLRLPSDGGRLQFRAFPTSALPPGRFVQFKEGFSERLRASGDPFRVVSLRFEAAIREQREEAFLEDEDAEYDTEIEATLERADEPHARLAPFKDPPYPRYVEAKIVSPAGGDEDRSWLVLEDEQTSLLQVEVEIPLFNKKVTAPFEPGPLNGRFFFPVYKHEKVLVALTFGEARLVRFLDWAANARTPTDGQGNRIVLGKRDKDGGWMEYAYVDQKPAFTLQRTQGNDLQTVAITEGSLKMTVREDPAVQKEEPKFDVTLQVEAAKGEISGAIRGSIGELDGKLETAVGGTTATLTGAIGEVKTSVEAMEAGIRGKLEEARAELDSAMESLNSALSGVVAAVASAKSEILSAVAD